MTTESPTDEAHSPMEAPSPEAPAAPASPGARGSGLDLTALLLASSSNEAELYAEKVTGAGGVWRRDSDPGRGVAAWGGET